MAEVAPAAAPAKTAKPKKKASVKRSDGPGLPKLIKDAIADSKDRKGISVSALKKVLASKGIDIAKHNKRVNNALKRMVAKGVVSQTKGTGASGSFKLAKTEAKAKVSKKKNSDKPKPARKPAAVKKTTPKKKKPATKGKKAAAKSPAKPKSPAKKAAKKAAAKSPKKPKKVAAKSPKKVGAKKPRPAKKAPAKKAAAKKPVAKKAKK